MPFAATNVELFRVLTDQQSVNIGAVYGAIWGPFDVRLYDSLAVEITNPDAAQTIDCFVDIAVAIAGPWSTSSWNGLAAIQPLETRADSFRKPGQLFFRLIAKAGGAGITGATLTVSGIQRRLISGGI